MATIESLVVRIAGESGGLEKAVDRAKNLLRKFAQSARSFGGFFTGFGKALLDGFLAPLKDVKALLFGFLDAFKDEIARAVAPEIKKLGEAVADLLGAGAAKTAINDFRDTIVGTVREAINAIAQFVRTLNVETLLTDLKQLGQTLLSIARGLGRIAELVVSIANGIQAFLKPFNALGGFLGRTAFDVGHGTGKLFDRLSGGASNADLLRESQNQTQALRDLSSQPAVLN